MIIPRRRYNHGTRPDVTGNEVLGKDSDDEVRWVFPPRDPTKEEKVKLFAAALEIAVRTIFKLHTYQFGGKLYQQSEGGPIGLRLTGACAKLVMASWSRKVNKILEREKIEVALAAGYIDDIRYLTTIIEKGRRWDEKEKRFVKKGEWEREDEESNQSDNERTSKEIRKVMNSVYQNIQFTSEIPSDFENQRLPTLDFEMWLEKEGENKGKILHTFFEKPMSSKYCVMEKGAMPQNTKTSTLSQEIVRRMMNTSELVNQIERNQIIEKFIKKLRRSGYDEKQIRNIVESGLKGYQSKLERSIVEGRDLHRDDKSTAGSRFKKKLLAKSNWFKKGTKKDQGNKVHNGTCKPPGQRERKRKNIPPATVFFVPRTPNGELATLLREAEQDIAKLTGDRIKIVEKSGKMMKSSLQNSNPWSGENCGRNECLVCKDKITSNGDCRKRNILYQTFCLECKKAGKDSIYIGESSRTGFERGGEHQYDFKTKAEDSHMFLHQSEEHGDMEIKFSMKIVKQFQSSFRRQVHEAVSISRNSSRNILNSKLEYNRCILPRLSVMMGSQESTESKEKVNSKGYVQLV